MFPPSLSPSLPPSPLPPGSAALWATVKEKGSDDMFGGGQTKEASPEVTAEVDPIDICDWFRPHVAATILLPTRTEEQLLLMQVGGSSPLGGWYEFPTACLLPIT